MEWIITCKTIGDNGYRIFDAFNDFLEIDWHRSSVSRNIKKEDIVYIYIGAPYKKIMFKTICTETLVTNNNLLIDDSKYYNNKLKWNYTSKDNFFRLKLLEKIDKEELSLEYLNQLTLVKGNIQGTFKSENNPELFAYINKQFATSNDRILFCNIAYMKNYDTSIFEEVPVNGGSYVTKTKKAYEKNNFHIHEDGMVRGFVETKYVDGAFGEQKKPKQLRIENIDEQYKNKNLIDNVLVIFCAHSPIVNKTVIVGWYKNAIVLRSREIYNNQQYNLLANYKDAILLREDERIMEIPRAPKNKDNIGFGQSNVWYANNPEHQDFVKKVIEYVNCTESNLKRKNMSQKNEYEDDRLNNIIKNVMFDKDDHFEYTDDILPKPEAYESKKGIIYYKRDREKAINALKHAGFKCEYNPKHESFIRKNDGVRYTEAHHLVPMSQQDQFDVSLDIEENIVSLCSNCHNEIHYGKNAQILVIKLFNERKDLLKRKGITLSLEELLSYYK